MNFSAVFIRRPVATILLAIALTAAGIFAYRYVPVAALPEVEFPTITVSASLPGAAPDTMASSVATPLIKQFSTIPAISSITATSSQGSTSIVIQFDLNRDIDQAAADVQAAIARTNRQLPAAMTTPPSYRKVNPADAPVLQLALSSDAQTLTKLDDYAEDVIAPALSTVEGVGEVSVFGAKKYAVRVEINPEALYARGIGIDQVVSALSANNSISPVGTLNGDRQQLAIEANTQLGDAAAFRDIIISTPNNKPVRLGDVANVVDSVANTITSSTYDGHPVLLLGVQRQPGANTVDVVKRVKAMLPKFENDLGPTAKINVLNDRSTSIQAAVEDVSFTLLLTIGLVVLVIFLFLRRLSATAIPALAVPISLIATLAVMYVLGFSIDNISLLGLTLSVGLVVDDAIVMLENIVRYIEEGMRPFDAALKGAAEIGFTILSITVSLIAVFIPVLLMGGVVGRLFNEFAMVVTIAIAASALVSLTLTPMLCSHLPAEGKEHHALAFAEKVFDWLLGLYRVGLDFILRFRIIGLALFVGSIAATAVLFTIIPKSFLPEEDIGQLQVRTQARQDISYSAMRALQAKVLKIIEDRPYVAHVGSVVGGGFGASSLNTGSIFVDLKPKSERGDINSVMADLRRAVAQVPGIQTFAVPVQNLRIGGVSSSSQYQFQVLGIDRDELNLWSTKIADAMQKDPTFTDVTTNLQNNAIHANLVVDMDRARSFGLTADQIRTTLYAGFGTQQASTIYKTGDSYSVIVELDPSQSWTSDKLDQLRVRSTTTGKLIPISAFAHVERKAGLLSISQSGQLASVTISFNLPAGISLGQAVERTNAIKAELDVPSTISTAFAGTAQVFQQALANQGTLLLGAVLTIYIVLGILYESFIHPLTILTGLPAAAAGALGTLVLFGYDLSVIAIIGVLMLIGIVKKNAIMMIDFAVTRRRAGESALQSIREACLIRFRPIMMTTMAAIMGTLPIAIGSGASSELRQPLGVAVVGGLVVSQLLTLFITPVVYLYMDQLSVWLGGLVARFRGGHRDRRGIDQRDDEEEGLPIAAE
jgi:HAE1 family hydrophobic/amphiphilic exporter-1